MNAKRMQPGTRELILDAALTILSERGLSAVTLGRIARHVGMSKSGLFAHFRSIEEIHIAVVNYTDELFRAEVRSASLQETAVSQLLQTVTRWFAWASPGGPFKGAPLLSALFESGQGGGRVRDVLMEKENAWRAHLEELVSAVISGDTFRNELHAQQFVEELCGIYYNYAVCERFLGRSDAGEAAAKAVNAVFARAFSQRAREAGFG